MAKLALNAWDYKDKHIDESLDQHQFMTSSRVVIYTSVNYGGTNSDNYGDFYPIGVIQGYSWSEQRQIDMIFELGSEIPYLIPGRTTGQISISRMLIYGFDLINVLQGADQRQPDTWIKSLKDITKPVNLLFAAFGNTNTDNSSQTVYSRLFSGCWITARNESLSAGQTLIAENCSIMYQKIDDIDITVG